jgi:uncharacterized coiled-coil protein SlyX
MAKALLGYLPTNARSADRLEIENARLRNRVADLEELAARLSHEIDALNDALVEARASELLSSDLQPA